MDQEQDRLLQQINAAKIPGVDEAARETNLRIDEQARLARAQERFTGAIVSGEEEAQKMENKVNELTQKLEETKGKVAETARRVDALRGETNELSYQIAGRQNVLETAELGIEKTDKKADTEIAQIEADLELQLQKIDDETDGLLDGEGNVAVEEISKLKVLLEQELKDVEAGNRLVGTPTPDTEGGLQFDQKKISDLEQIYGPNSPEVEKAKQTRVGGEMASAVTEEMIEAKRKEWEDKEQKINDEAEAKKASVRAEAEAKKASVRAEAEAKKQELQTLIDTTHDEIESLADKRNDLYNEQLGKKEELTKLVAEQKKMEGEVESSNAEALKFQEEVARNRDLLSRVVEKMDAVSEKGVSAVGNLREVTQIISNRLEALDIAHEIAVRSVRDWSRDAIRGLREAYKNKVAEANTTYDARLKEMSGQIVEKNPESFGLDNEGNLVSKAVGLEAMFAMREVTETMSGSFDEAKKQRAESEKTAAEERDSNVTNVMERLERIVAGLDKDASEERMKLRDAAEMARTLQATAEDVFGSEATTQESAPKQQSFLTRTKSFFTRIFGRK